MDRSVASVSPTRRSFSDKLSAFGARLSRTISNDGTLAGDDSHSISGIMTKPDRSVSRGRDVYSSGRGGAGNIRQSPSASRTRGGDGPEDLSSITRGREGGPAQTTRNFSIGRGGVGNIRSPSREVGSRPPINPDIEEEERVLRSRVAATTQDGLHSSGRGGAGNIQSRSRSRDPTSPSLSSPVRSTGRGGAGNIITGPGPFIDEKDEANLKEEHSHTDRTHLTGRGGVANVTAGVEPPVERYTYQHHEYESTGRGGAGNIVHG